MRALDDVPDALALVYDDGGGDQTMGAPAESTKMGGGGGGVSRLVKSLTIAG